MKTKIYSAEEEKILRKNPFVIDILYNRFISYDPVFKLWCVLQRKFNPYKTSRDLFKECGFPVSIMNPNLFRSRISDWIDLFNRYGVSYFLSNQNYAMIQLSSESFPTFCDNPIKIKVYNDIFELVKRL